VRRTAATTSKRTRCACERKDSRCEGTAADLPARQI
jgi:hypothetical protein